MAEPLVEADSLEQSKHMATMYHASNGDDQLEQPMSVSVTAGADLDPKLRLGAAS